jgi:hypothetical protein
MAEASGVIDNDGIRDSDFIAQLDYLRFLRAFVVKEGIELPAGTNATDLENLANLQLKLSGRAPTREEWTSVDSKIRVLISTLDEPRRKKFRISRASSVLVIMPWFLTFIAVVLLLTPLLFEYFALHLLIVFVFWLLCLGSLGSMAFILVNALGLHVDPLVDVTNKQLVMIRAGLGALFALILTLPFGFVAFQAFYRSVQTGGPFEQKDALTLLMPFLLGFSTSLVLSVLNRLIESVQTFFGVKSETTDSRSTAQK